MGCPTEGVYTLEWVGVCVFWSTERVSLIALDINGSNFRVLLVELNDQGMRIEVDRVYIPNEILTGKANQVLGVNVCIR